MKKILVSKLSKKLSTFVLVFGILVLVVGIIRLVMRIESGEPLVWDKKSVITVLNIAQGSLFIWIWWHFRGRQKYFLEWDDDSLRYRLVNDVHINEIKFADIHEIDIKSNAIYLVMNDYTNRKLNLEQMNEEDIKVVKVKFEHLIEIGIG